MSKKYSKLSHPEKLLVLRDMGAAVEYGTLTKGTRVQVKMPDLVVQALDELYPETDRSSIITQLAIEAILRRERFADRPELAELVESEQAELDDMWNFLEERDAL